MKGDGCKTPIPQSSGYLVTRYRIAINPLIGSCTADHGRPGFVPAARSRCSVCCQSIAVTRGSFMPQFTLNHRQPDRAGSARGARSFVQKRIGNERDGNQNSASRAFQLDRHPRGREVGRVKGPLATRWAGHCQHFGVVHPLHLPFHCYMCIMLGMVTVSHLSCAILRSPIRDAAQIDRYPNRCLILSTASSNDFRRSRRTASLNMSSWTG